MISVVEVFVTFNNFWILQNDLFFKLKETTWTLRTNVAKAVCHYAAVSSDKKFYSYLASTNIQVNKESHSQIVSKKRNEGSITVNNLKNSNHDEWKPRPFFTQKQRILWLRQSLLYYKIYSYKIF